MALFGKTKEKKVKVATEKISPVLKDTSVLSTRISKEPSDIILKPRVTEKATDLQGNNVYVFEINSKANKNEVRLAFAKIYKIIPIKVNIVKNPAKNVVIRGKRGVKKGVKKAYIYLKEGDKIETV
ncbi:MAG: 50S ribosomal protein L23 [Patescibacteria group bacterium]